MAKKQTKPQTARKPFDPAKFENPLQVGGIRTGTLDYPNPSGGQSVRVAHVDTGSGLTFVVALDRGGDIVEAKFKGTALAYLTPNDYAPPSCAYNREADWLTGWPGGLLTTCGPVHIGAPREEDDTQVTLHGRFSNTPAAVEMIVNPDPGRGRNEMLLSMVIRDTRMFGPNVEIRRQIQCHLGEPTIRLYDQVINRGDTTIPHSLLYHCNLGYPLVDRGARFIYKCKGKATILCEPPSEASAALISKLKTVRPPSKAHAGTNQEVVLTDVPGDRDGLARAGLINDTRGLAVEFAWPVEALPRFANWQHFGPRGSYVTGIEPYSGTLIGKENDDHPLAEQFLKPDEAKRYQLNISVHDDQKAIAALAKHDGPLKV